MPLIRPRVPAATEALEPAAALAIKRSKRSSRAKGSVSMVVAAPVLNGGARRFHRRGYKSSASDATRRLSDIQLSGWV